MRKQKNKDFRYPPIWLCLSLFLGWMTLGLSGIDTLGMIQLTSEHGLSQNSIYGISRDRTGFIWLATQDGLNRYDGYTFRTYRPDKAIPDGLSSIFLNALLLDSRGYLWIGTNGGGLNRMDPVNETWLRLRNDPARPSSLASDYVTALAEDGEGRIWVGTLAGLSVVDPVALTCRTITTQTHPQWLGSNTLTTIYRAPDGAMWIGTNGGGLTRHDPAKNSWQTVRRSPGKSDSLADDTVLAFWQDLDQTVWVGTNQGLDRTNTALEHFTHAPAAENQSAAKRTVRTILRDQAGWLWVGTNSGLCLFTQNSDTFNPEILLSGQPITALHEDQTGLVWIGSETSGLTIFDRNHHSFPLYRHDEDRADSLGYDVLRTIKVDPSGGVWLATEGKGLDHLTADTQTFEHHQSLPGLRLLAMERTKEGLFWISTRDGDLFTYDPESRKSLDQLPLLLPFNIPAPLQIRALFQGNDNSLWLGGDGTGLIRVPADGSAIRQYYPRVDEQGNLTTRSIRTIHADHQGQIWVGSNNGLCVFDPIKERFTCYDHPDAVTPNQAENIFISITPIPDGTLWLGTFGGGLCHLDPRSGSWSTFTVDDGLPNNVIYGIIPDRENRLWISTNRGLCRFNPRTMEVHQFEPGDGLQGWEYNAGSYAVGPDGRMYFGGMNGFNAFYPTEIGLNQRRPPLAITRISSFNQTIIVPDLNKTPISAITLSHRQNTLSFEFVALNFIKPAKNRYAYRLLGLEKEWVEANTRRSAAYANLAPGRYSFQVKGSNNDGLWNETPAQLDFIINPPWWRTWPAYLTLLIVLGGSLLLVRRYEMGRERQKADLRESELRLLAAESQARALQAEHQRKTQELEEARLLQLSMLPRRLPDIPGWDLSVFMSTASEVGGDYYDFHPQCRDGLMTAVVGDATGHGLKAGTLVAVIKGLFMAESSDGDFKTFMNRCATTIQRMNLGNLYMGLILLRLGPGRAALCSAGMPPVILFEAAKGKARPIQLKGLPLGASNPRPVACQELTMGPGDTLLLLSDGLAEAFNEQGQMFGYQRIQDIFSRTAPLGPDQVISALTQASQEWLQGSPPEDDITLMALRFLG